jgi:hypothetical protein
MPSFDLPKLVGAASAPVALIEFEERHRNRPDHSAASDVQELAQITWQAAIEET